VNDELLVASTELESEIDGAKVPFWPFLSVVIVCEYEEGEGCFRAAF